MKNRSVPVAERRVAICLRNLVFILLLGSAGASQAADVYVDAASGCIMDCGSALQPYPSIQPAVDAAVAGDTVRVGSGVYTNPVSIGKSLSLIGEAGAQLTVGSGDTAILIEASGVQISGLTLLGAGAGIGINSRFSRDLVIADNRIEGFQTGLVMYYTQGSNVVKGNRIGFNTQGVSFGLFFGTVTLHDNEIYDNNRAFGGMDIRSIGGATIYHNNFIGNAVQELTGNTFVRSYTEGGNYWSNWSGPDVNADGVVDRPFGNDYFPVTQPGGWATITPEKSVHNRTSMVDFSEIGDALAAALPGDLIEVDAGDVTGKGHYYESVDITTPITLSGAPGATLFATNFGTPVIVSEDTVTVRGFEVVGNGRTSGIMVNFARDVLVTDNTVHGNQTGISLYYTYGGEPVTVSENRIRDNLQGISMGLIFGDIVVTGNEVTGNTRAFGGVDVRSQMPAKIYHNNFIDNDVQVLSGNTRVLGYSDGGNYWSHWTGPDINGDGVVDQPAGNDYFPVTVPNGWATIIPERSVHNRTSGMAYSEIEHAVAAAVDGDLIEVDGGEITGKGRYYEAVRLTRPVTLASRESATLVRTVLGNPLEIRGSNIQVAGFNVEGNGQGDGVLVNFSRDVEVSDMVLDNHQTGLRIYYATGPVLAHGNLMSNNRQGISMGLIFGPITLYENDVIDNERAFGGMDIRNTDGALIYHNNFIGNALQELTGNAHVLDYPEGGNHWSNWTGPDLFSGALQDIAGADGVVDLQFGNDRYPFVKANGWVPTNTPPVAVLAPLPTLYPGEAGLLDASASYDNEGTIARFSFAPGDSTQYVEDTNLAPDGVFDGVYEYAYAAVGTYPVTVTVADAEGLEHTVAGDLKVMSFADGIGELATLVESYYLSKGIENALLVKLNGALKALTRGYSLDAKDKLQSFIDQVSDTGFCAAQTPEGFCADVLPPAQRIIALL